MNGAAFEKLGIKPFDAAEYLQSDADCAAYLQACIEQAPDDAAPDTGSLRYGQRDTSGHKRPVQILEQKSHQIRRQRHLAHCKQE